MPSNDEVNFTLPYTRLQYTVAESSCRGRTPLPPAQSWPVVSRHATSAQAALPPRAELLLSELPVHLAAAAAPDAQLQGLRLNVLRLVYELSAAPCAAPLRRGDTRP